MIVTEPIMPLILIHTDIIVDGEVRDVYLRATDNFMEKSESKIALDEYKGREEYERFRFCAISYRKNSSSYCGRFSEFCHT